MGPLHRRSPRRLLLIAALLAAAVLPVVGPARAAAPVMVRYPVSESSTDARASYPLALLRLALDRSGGNYVLVPSRARMQQSRALRQLAKGEGLDVAWSVTSREREATLRPIRLPIDRGLLGWRVLLIQRGDAPRFAAIDGLAGLAPLTGGQGHDWPDLPVLRANGLRVAASPSYDGLFAMLARGHIDYFPRSVVEAGAEVRNRPALPLAIEPHLLLRYPSALYFFVQRDNAALARAIDDGLETALRDGSWKALFERTYGATLDRLDLGHRRIVPLANPDLPAATPLARRELWFRPGVAR